MKLVLASSSSARRAMLQSAGVPFEPRDSDFDEEEARARLGAAGPSEVAAALAEGKALSAVAAKGDIVLGADQTLERQDGSLLAKPGSRDEAMMQLRSLGGRTHRLHSAAAIAENGAIVWRGSETAALTMRPLSDEFLERYLDHEYDAIRWSVGGYRIEGLGAQLFERIEGSHFAILGLPLLPLLSWLRKRGLLPS
jgi:septum formation protein